MASSAQAIVCDHCGKSFSFKPEYAGRKLKCKCGNVLQVEAPAEESAFGEYSLELTPEERQKQERLAAARKAGKCPECDNPVDRDAILCVSCGYNFKSGKKLGTQLLGADDQVISPAAARGKRVEQKRFKDKPKKKAKSSPTPAPARQPNRKPDAHAGEERRKLVNLGIGVAAVLVIVGGGIGALQFLGGATPSATAPAPGQDDEARKLIAEQGQEAREWLKGPPNRMIGGMTMSQAEQRINSWYEMGNKKVYTIGGTSVLRVVFELPDDAEQRARIFDWQAKWHEERNETVIKDEGQKFLIIKLNL